MNTHHKKIFGFIDNLYLLRCRWFRSLNRGKKRSIEDRQGNPEVKGKSPPKTHRTLRPLFPLLKGSFSFSLFLLLPKYRQISYEDYKNLYGSYEVCKVKVTPKNFLLFLTNHLKIFLKTNRIKQLSFFSLMWLIYKYRNCRFPNSEVET